MDSKESNGRSPTETLPIEVPEGSATVKVFDTGPEIRLAAKRARPVASSRLGGERTG